MKRILPLGRSQTAWGPPGFNSTPGRWKHPQNLTNFTFASLWPTKTHNTSLERSEPPKQTYNQFRGLVESLIQVMISQSDPVSIVLMLRGSVSFFITAIIPYRRWWFVRVVWNWVMWNRMMRNWVMWNRMMRYRMMRDRVMARVMRGWGWGRGLRGVVRVIIISNIDFNREWMTRSRFSNHYSFWWFIHINNSVYRAMRGRPFSK